MRWSCLAFLKPSQSPTDTRGVDQLVTDEHEAAMKSRIIAAVQAELDRHATTIVAENAKLRADAIRERDDLHREYGDRLADLARTVESMSAQNVELRRELEQQTATQMTSRVDAKITELESRLNRRVEELGSTIETLVSDAARPLLQSMHDEHESTVRRVDVLDADLRKFDEQAARLVVHFNELTAKIQQRAAETAEQLEAGVTRRIEELDGRIEEVSSSSIRKHAETSKLVGERSDRLEERVNIRVSAVEGAIREEVGARIAEIDAHVGRVSQGLDDTLNVLGDRMTALDQTVREFDERLDKLREEFGDVDAESLDELKEKLSAAAGESVLIRMDLEKLEKVTTERVESANARLATVESQLADTTMDVSTAVQLERLEELERAVIELDPNKFVLRTAHDDHQSDHDTEREAASGAA